jgi:hypothetical protein
MNPLETLEETINKATDKMLIGPDWALNLQIIDTLNNNSEIASQVGQIIRKRLKNRSGKVVSLTIDLLDALLKNCPSIYAVSGSTEMMTDLMSIATTTSPKKSFRVAKEKALDFIQFWGETFKGNGELHFYEAYTALLRKGVSFPPKRQDKFTPSIQRNGGLQRSESSGVSQTPNVQKQSPANSPSSIQQLLETSKTNGELLRQLLLNIPPMTESAEVKKYVAANELIQEVVSVCRQLHSRLVSLVSEAQGLDERQTATLLDLTTTLVESLTLYDDALQQGVHPTQNPLQKRLSQAPSNSTMSTTPSTTSLPLSSSSSSSSTMATTAVAKSKHQMHSSQKSSQKSKNKHKDDLKKRNDTETISIVLPGNNKRKPKENEKDTEKQRTVQQPAEESTLVKFPPETYPTTTSAPVSSSSRNVIKREMNESLDDEFVNLARRERPADISSNNTQNNVTTASGNPFAPLLLASTTPPSSTWVLQSSSSFITSSSSPTSTAIPLFNSTTSPTSASSLSNVITTNLPNTTVSTSLYSSPQTQFAPLTNTPSTLIPNSVPNPNSNYPYSLALNNPFLTFVPTNTVTVPNTTLSSPIPAVLGPTHGTSVTTSKSPSADDEFKDL